MIKLVASFSPVSNRRVTISEFDYPRLKELLIEARHDSDDPLPYLDDLENELQRACIVPSDQIPPYVVTMNTQVRLTDTKTGKSSTYTIVFPSHADVENGKLPILSEIGAAIIGHFVGDTIEWECSEGQKCMRIDMICFQPEATKQFDL